MPLYSRDELLEICKAPSDKKAYIRPFICKGRQDDAKVFLVGINPATPFSPDKIEIDDYIDIISDYDSFTNFYLSQKKRMSKTRIGITALVNFLADVTKSSVIETNIVAYPTRNYKLLKKEPPEIITQGKKIFLDLLQRVRPRLLVMHGKETVKMALELFNEEGLISEGQISNIGVIQDYESKVPIFVITYKDGSKGYIAACRHLMYYGYEGKSYYEFKERLKGFVKNLVFE